MRLPIIFAAFYLGLLANSPVKSGGFPWFEIIAIGAILLSLAIFPELKNIRFICFCLIAFFLGSFRMADPGPLNPEPEADLHSQNGAFTIIGKAENDTFTSLDGKFLPLSVTAIIPDGDSPRYPNLSVTGKDIVIVEVGNDFIGISGSIYCARGEIITDASILTSPIISRYQPVAIIKTRVKMGTIFKLRDSTGFQNSLNNLRYRLLSHLSWNIPESEETLVSGIVFGRRLRQPDSNWADDFYGCGLSHLIVASGAQVSLLFAPAFLFLSNFKPPRKIKWLLLLTLGFFLFSFAKLLGGEPSILRAATMGIIFLIAIGTGRRSQPLAAMACAALFWLIKNPLLVSDTSFLLSLGASFGIIYIGPILTERLAFLHIKDFPKPISPPPRNIGFIILGILRKILGFLISCAIVNFSAQIGVVPVLLCTIGRFSPFGFFANLLAVPLGQLVLFFGALSGISGFFCPVLSMSINSILGFIAGKLISIAHYFASIPLASVRIQPMPVMAGILYYIAVIYIVEKFRPTGINRQKKKGVLPVSPSQNPSL